MHNTSSIRCVVVDDEPLAVDLLAEYVTKTPGLELVYKTTRVLEVLPLVQEGKVDLIFLDIQMPELTGIQFLKIIKNSCLIIFTTAYSDYAVEGYEHDVVDYLLKPVTFDRFVLAVSKAQRRFAQAGAATAGEMPDHIFVKTEYRIQKISLDDILYIEAKRDYIAIYMAAGKILSLESLRNMETILPSQRFIRIHKSYIINKDKIEFIERGKVVINKEYLPVGDTYRNKFMALIKAG